MTILSLGAYVKQLEAIKTMASTFDLSTPSNTWTVPYAAKAKMSKKAVAGSVRTITHAPGPLSTIEVLVETTYDNVGGQNYAAAELWSDGKTSYVVTLDVVNLLDILYKVYETLSAMQGSKKTSIEDYLLHVNDFNATSPMTRSSQQYAMHFGAQCLVICPNGSVMAIAFDRVTVTSQASTRFAWRGLSVDVGYDIALLTPSPTGFDTHPADGYIRTNNVRFPFFMHEFREMQTTKPESYNYAYKASGEAPNPLAKFTIAHPTTLIVE